MNAACRLVSMRLFRRIFLKQFRTYSSVISLQIDLSIAVTPRLISKKELGPKEKLLHVQAGKYNFSSVSAQLPKPDDVGDDIHIAFYGINAENSNVLKKKYESLAAEAHNGGGEKGIQRHVERNKKVLVRERIKHLLDQGSPFFEIGKIAGHDMEYGNIPCAGAVSGVGKIHGIWCMILANDATVKSGSIYPITLKKQLRAHNIAEENFLPTIFLVDSGGAFLPMQSEIFNLGGRMFYNQAIMSSLGIPQIALVCGSCTAGAAYIPSMTEQAVIVNRIGTIFLAGPPLVLAATGEDVTPEELGGADLHCRLSGVTDHFAENEQAGFSVVRNIIATSNFQGIKTGPPIGSCKELNKFAAASPEYSVSALKIIKCLADDGGFQEYKKRYGNTLVAGFMFINGNLTGVLANDGYLTENAANKGAHFMQLCDVRQIPVLFLQNMTHDENEESNGLQSAGVVKARAKLLQAIVMCKSPKIVLSTGGLIGSPHSHPMCSLSMGARFHFVWPNVKLGSSFLWQKKANKNQIPESMKLSKYEEIKHKSTAFYGASQLWYDGIVVPEDTKQVLYFCLNIFEQEKLARSRNWGKASHDAEVCAMFRM